MQRLLMSFTLVVMLLVALLVVAPVFISSDGYKDELIASIVKTTGLQPKVLGSVSFSFLPFPVVEVNDVAVANIVGAASSNIIHIDSVRVMPSWLSILKGEVDIKDVYLYQPTVELETLSDDSANWQMLQEAFSSRGGGDDVQMPQRVRIRNGTVSYWFEGYKRTLDYINTGVEYKKTYKTFFLDGSFVSGEHTINVYGKLDRNRDLVFESVSDSMELKIDGKFDVEKDEIAGKIDVNILDLSSVVNVLFGDDSVMSKVKSREKAKITGDVMFSMKGANFSNINVAADNINGRADFGVKVLQDDDLLKWDIDVDVVQVNLDALLFDSEVKKEVPDEEQNMDEIDYYAYTLSSASLSDYKFYVPQDVLAEVDVSVSEILYNKQAVDDVRFKMKMSSGEVHIDKLSVFLPGDSHFMFKGEVEHNGIRPLLSGNFELSGGSFRDVAVWMDESMQFLPAGELQDYLFSSDLEMTPQKIDFSNMSFSVDRTLMTGDVLVRPVGIVPSVKANVVINRFNMDRYDIPEGVGDYLSYIASIAVDSSIETSWLNTFNVDVDLDVEGRDLRLNEFDIDSVDASVSVTNGVLNVNKLYVVSDDVAFNSKLHVDVSGSDPLVTMVVKASDFDTGVLGLGSGLDEVGGEWRWSKKPFNFMGIDRFEGNVVFMCKNFKHGGLVMSDVDVEGVLRKKIFSLNKANASLYGGKIELKGDVGVLESSPSFGLSIMVSNVELADLLSVVGVDNGVKGKFFVSGNLKTFGASPYRWAVNYHMDAKVAARNLVMQRFGLDSIISSARNIYSVIDMDIVVKKAMEEGEVLFRGIDGDIVVDKGILKAHNFQLSTMLSRGVFAGNMSVMNFNTNGVVKIGFRPEAKKKVTLGMSFEGKVGNLKRKLDTSDLENYITAKGKR